MTPSGGQDFAGFVRLHWVELMQIATGVCGSRSDAEDLVQSALTSAYPRWDGIRPEQALAYLRRTIANAHISRWRRQRGVELVGLRDDDQFGPDWAADADERRDILELLQRLPARQRAVLMLRYISELSSAQTAATLGISESTVRSQTARALATLRAHLAADGDAATRRAPGQIARCR